MGGVYPPFSGGLIQEIEEIHGFTQWNNGDVSK
jgi:hypothetical protein